MEWRRLHPPPRSAKAIATVSSLAAVTAIVLIYASLLGFGQMPFAVAMYAAVGAILLGAWAWRRWSYGVFIGDGAIRITFVSGTMLIALSEVVAVDVRRSTQARRSGTAASSLWIILTDGIAMEAPVLRGRPHGGNYVPERPAGLYLSEPVFDAVVAELTAELGRHRRSG